VGIGTVQRRDHDIGVEDAGRHLRTQIGSAALFGAELLQVAGLVEAIEDTECGVKIRSRAVDDDAVRAFRLDHDLVAGPQAGRLKSLDRKSHLMLAGDARHTFTLA
jgi:hypothetical protein